MLYIYQVTMVINSKPIFIKYIYKLCLCQGGYVSGSVCAYLAKYQFTKRFQLNLEEIYLSVTFDIHLHSGKCYKSQDDVRLSIVMII